MSLTEEIIPPNIIAIVLAIKETNDPNAKVIFRIKESITPNIIAIFLTIKGTKGTVIAPAASS
jgi:hypothetical protein